MHLGVVDGPHPVAIPLAARGLVEQFGGDAFDGFLVPGTILGERLQRFPIHRPTQAHQTLGDGVLLDIEDQSGDPFAEALEAPVGERLREGGEEFLPMAPNLAKFHRAPPVVRTSAARQL